MGKTRPKFLVRNLPHSEAPPTGWIWSVRVDSKPTMTITTNYSYDPESYQRAAHILAIGQRRAVLRALQAQEEPTPNQP